MVAKRQPGSLSLEGQACETKCECLGAKLAHEYKTCRKLLRSCEVENHASCSQPGPAHNQAPVGGPALRAPGIPVVSTATRRLAAKYRIRGQPGKHPTVGRRLGSNGIRLPRRQYVSTRPAYPYYRISLPTGYLLMNLKILKKLKNLSSRQIRSGKRKAASYSRR